MRDTPLRRAIRNAVRGLAQDAPGAALTLTQQYLGDNLEEYDKATIYHLGQMVERARQVPSRTTPSLSDISQYVGEANHQKGMDYQLRVYDIQVHEDMISATVEGTNDYETWTALENSRIVDSYCSCPVRSKVCKHVAALLIYYAVHNTETRPTQTTVIQQIADLL